MEKAFDFKSTIIQTYENRKGRVRLVIVVIQVDENALVNWIYIAELYGSFKHDSFTQDITIFIWFYDYLCPVDS